MQLCYNQIARLLRRSLVALGCLLVVSHSALAQKSGGDARWANGPVAGNNSSEGLRIVHDAQLNSYVVGIFQGTITLGSVTMTSKGERDGYLAKYDPNGQLVWVRQMGSTEADIPLGLAIHPPTGDLFVTGIFHNGMEIITPNQTLTLNTDFVGPPNNQDIFIAKFDNNGQALWATKIGNAVDNVFEQAEDIAVDNAGNCYAVGVIYTDARFHSSPLSAKPFQVVNPAQPGFAKEGFLAKYLGGNGELDWVRTMGGSNSDEANCVVINRAGNVIVAGSFDNTANNASIDGQAVASLITPGPSDEKGMFVAAWDLNGNRIWVRAYASRSGGEAFPRRMAIDPNGYFSIIGDYTGSLHVTGPFTNAPATLNSVGSVDNFFLKLGGFGIQQWVRSGGGPNPESATSVTVDDAGNSYFIGYYRPGSTFGPFNMTGPNYPNQCHYFIKIDPLGNYVWADAYTPFLTDHSVTGDGCRFFGTGRIFQPPPTNRIGNVTIPYNLTGGNRGDLVYRFDLVKGGQIAPISTIPTGPICRGSNANQTGGTIHLANVVGSIIRWESSTDCPAFTNPQAINQTVPSLPWANLAQTTCFRAVVRNGNCEDFSEVAQINILPDPVVSINPPGPLQVCFLESKLIEAQGADFYSWTALPMFAPNLQSPSTANPSFFGSSPGSAIYTVTGVDANGCSSQATISIEVLVTPRPNALGINPPGPLTLCADQVQRLDAAPPTLSFYSWAPANNLSATSTPSTQFASSTAGTYTYTLTAGTNPVCTSTAEIQITVVGLPVIDINPPSPLQVCLGESVNLTASGATTYNWAPATDLSSTNAANPTLIASTLGTRTYTVTGIDANGCANTAQVDVVVTPGTAMSITPAGPLTLCVNQSQLLTATGADSYSWAPATNLTSATSPSTLFSAAAPGTYTYVVSGTKLNGCTGSAEVTITVVAAQTVTATGPADVCAGQSATLTGLAVSGSPQWQRASGPGCVTPWVNIPAANAFSYTTPALNPGDVNCFRLVVTDPLCGTVESAPVLININPASIGGLTSATTMVVCTPPNTGTVVVNGQSGQVVRWESSTNQVAWTPINVTATTYTFVDLLQTTWFRAVVQNPGCAEAPSLPVRIEVISGPVGGSIGPDQTLCAGSRHTFDLTGSTGQLLRWEFSFDNFASVAGSVPPSTQTPLQLTTPILNQTVSYRAVVGAAGCPEVYSNVATLTVTTGSGVVAPPISEFCGAAPSRFFSLTAFSGNIIRWERSTDCANFSNPVPVAATTPTLSVQAGITQTTCFRAVTDNPACPYSTPAEVRISPNTAGGTISGAPAGPVCAPAGPFNLTLTNQVGDVLRWERSTDNGLTWQAIGNAGNTVLAVNQLTQNTLFRVRVQSGLCPPQYSQPARVDIAPSPVAAPITSSGPATVCAGASGVLTLSPAANGIVQRWEVSTDNFATAPTVFNTSNRFFTYSNVSQTTQYRAVLATNTCPPVTTPVFTLTVTPQTVPGTINGPATVCSGTNSGSLVLTGHTGAILRWEVSTNNFLTVTTLPAVANFLNYSNLTATTRYRAVVRSGSCAQRTTQPVEVTVLPAPVGGTLLGPPSVCGSPNTAQLDLRSFVGPIVRWEKSTNNFTTAPTVINHTQPSYTASNLAVTTQFRAVVGDPQCGFATSTVWEVKVNPASVGGNAVASTPSLCTSGAASVSLLNSVGNLERWEKSVGACNGPWQPIASSANLFTFNDPQPVQQTTCYRAIVRNGTCAPVASAPAEIKVYRNPIAGFNATPVRCKGESNGAITLRATSFNFEFSIDGGATYQPATPPAIQFTGLAAGSYPVRARNLSQTCVFSGPTVVVSEPAVALAVANLQTRAPRCNQPNTGLVDLTVTGGTAPYAFRWSNGAQTEDLVNVASGTYTVTITDRNGCEQVTSAVVPAASSVSVSAAVNDVSCFGSRDGAISATATGGTPPYAYNWSIGGPTNLSSRSNLAAGQYTLVVVDAAGCSSTQTYIIVEPPRLTTQISTTPTTCPTAAVGSASVTAAGGTPPYSYLWSNNQTGSLIQNLRAGTYAVSVADSRGCQIADQAVVTASQTAPTVSLPAATPNALCGSGSTTLSVAANANEVYTWYRDSTLTQAAGNGPVLVVPVTATTTFYVTAANVLNPTCISAPSSITVRVSAPTVGGTAGPSATVCPNSNSGTVSLTGFTGSVLRWEESTDNFATNVVAVNNTLPSLSYAALTQTKSFRAVVASPGCPQAFSTPATITVAANCGQISASPSVLAFPTIASGCGSPVLEVNVSATGLTAPLVITAPADFEIALTPAGPFGPSLTINPTASNVAPRFISVRVRPNAPVGSYSGTLVLSSTNVTSQNVNLSAVVAASPASVVNLVPASLNLGTVPLGDYSGVQSYRLQVLNPAAGGVLVQAPAPFQVSLSANGPFTSVLVVPTVPCQNVNTLVYVRFLGTAPGPLSGNIAHSNGSAAASLPVTGNVLATSARPVVVTNPNWNSQADVDNTLGPNQFTWQVDAFNDLQTAIDAVLSGGRVLLNGPIHFGDNVRVPRPMTIQGSGPTQTTVRPMSNRRNTYPTGDPREALDPAYDHKHGFIIASSDVTIRDLTISGDPSLDCSERFGVGILNDDRSNVRYDNLIVDNVRVEFTYSKGIQFYNTGVKHQIRNSAIDDVCLRFDSDPQIYPTATGIFVNDPADIENNLVSRSGTGIRVEGNFGASAGLSTIRGNVILEQEATGIDADLRPASTPNFVQVAGNTITGVGAFGIDARGFDENAIIGGPAPAHRNVITPSTRPNRGPAVGARVSNSLGVLVQNIEVNAAGLESGLWILQNTDRNRPVRVTEADLRRVGAFASNPANGQSAGLFMSELGQYLDGNVGESFAHIWNSTISGFNVGIFTNENAQRDIEILVGGNNVAQPSVTIHSCDYGMIINGRSQGTVGRNLRTIRDNRVGIWVYGGELIMEGSRMANNQTAIQVDDKPLFNTVFESIVTMTNNLFEGNGINIDNRSSRPVQASFNYWGSNNAALVNASMRQTGSGIDFSPWLDSGIDTDNNSQNGFDGDYSFVHIDARSFQIGGLSHLQEAVNEPRVQRVFVHDGAYAGNTNVTRSLTLTNDGLAPLPQLASLSINGGGSRLTLERGFEITSSLTLTNGLVELLNNSTLQLNLTSVLTGGNDFSYVIGRLARQSAAVSATDLFFPIGSATAYRPATLNVAQQSNATNTYTGRVVEPNLLVRSLPAGVLSASTVRQWAFEQSGPAAVSGFQFDGAFGADDPHSNTPAELALLKDNGPSSTAWLNLDGTAGNGSIRSTAPFTSLGNFVLGRRSSAGPVTPGTLNLTAVLNVSTNSALPTWTSLNCPAAQYEVRYRVKGSVGNYSTATVTTTFALLNGLQHNTTYEVSVRGRCGSQPFSPWSTGTVTEFTTQSLGDCNVAGTPPVPGNLHISQVTARTALVNWRRVTNTSTQGYIVSFGDAALNPNSWPQFVVCNPATSFLISGLTPGRTYGVRVRTNCSNCTTALSSNDRRSNWSQVENFTTLNSRESDPQTSASSSVSVYPNPTTGQFTLRFDATAAGEAQVVLTDLTGRVLVERAWTVGDGRNELSVSLEGYAAGLYLLRVRQADREHQVKVILD